MKYYKQNGEEYSFSKEPEFNIKSENENLGFLNQWEDKSIDIGGQKHRCEAPNESKDYIYGCAIWVCYEDELDELVVENGEYGSQVNYCPYCGYEAKNKIKTS